MEYWQKQNDETRYNALENCKTKKQLHQARGELAVMKMLLNTVKDAKAMLAQLPNGYFIDEQGYQEEGNPLEH